TREVLLAHSRGTKATSRRTIELGADRRRHDRRSPGNAGVAMTDAWRRARVALRRLFGRAALERETAEEFESHLALRADDLERRGMSRVLAERSARIEFGGVEVQKEAARDVRAVRLWDELRANLVFGVRGIGHHPIQSLIVVTTLTLGLGI